MGRGGQLVVGALMHAYPAGLSVPPDPLVPRDGTGVVGLKSAMADVLSQLRISAPMANLTGLSE